MKDTQERSGTGAYPPPPPPPTPPAAEQPRKRHLVLRFFIVLVAVLAALFAVITLALGPDDGDTGGIDQAVIDAQAEICTAARFIAQDGDFYAGEADPTIRQVTAAKMATEAGLVAAAVADAPAGVDAQIRSAAEAVAAASAVDPADPAAVAALDATNDTLLAACTAAGA